MTQILFTNICMCRESKKKIPVNASFWSRGVARGTDVHSSCRMRQIDYIARQPLEHLCSWTTWKAKQIPCIQLKFQWVQIPQMPPKFLPSVPWNLGQKVHRTFQAILLGFWGSSWQPKLPSSLLVVVTSRIPNGGSDPTEAYRMHLAGYPAKSPPLMQEYCSLLARHRWYMPHIPPSVNGVF